jgi:ABC-type multidrug transport system fused ATPase/permease subunit
MQTFKKLFFLLTPNEKKQSGLLLIMMFIVSLLEMTGVASILPFVTVLTNPNLIDTNFFLNYIFEISIFFGVENKKQFIIALGIFVFIILTISLFCRIFSSYVQARFVQRCEYIISRRLIEVYLNQPYSWFLSHHSADFGQNILSQVQQIISEGILPLIDFISKSMIAIAIIILLIVIDPKLALIVGFSLSTIYLIIFYLVRKHLNRSGSKRLMHNHLRFKTVIEAFGAAKEVKIGALENYYIKRFSNSAQIYARVQSSQRVIAQLPRSILEFVVYGGILLMLFHIMSQVGSFNSALPIITLYVFAGYRLMPALQQTYEALTQLTFIFPSLDKLYDDLKNLKLLNQNQDIVFFNRSVTLNNIHYNYPNSSKTVLKDINLSISAKSTVGFVGATGSGKTTMVDIIMGLHEPQQGTLEIDGKIITKQNSRSWQRSIGHVPQQIFLADDTIAANIAFGLDPKDINQEAVKKASKIANLHEFVINELPKQYQTIIGERGVRLSGGQCQRIGIARALYHNPQLLILDEATSALDNQTEKAVMDAIKNLGKNITIILIAHRLRTVKKCDKIFLLEKGQVIGQGSFEELINSNKDFRKNAIL